MKKCCKQNEKNKDLNISAIAPLVERGKTPSNSDRVFSREKTPSNSVENACFRTELMNIKKVVILLFNHKNIFVKHNHIFVKSYKLV